MNTSFSNYQLILTSAFCVGKDTLVKQWIIQPSHSYNVLFIPNAADPNKIDSNYPSRVIDDKDALEELGYKVDMIDMQAYTKEWLHEKMKNADCVFVAWGNTFWLLACMQKVEFKSLIEEYLASGWCYIGSSAWSCICSPDITYVQFADDKSVTPITDYSGLNLINVAIKPHYNGEGTIPQSIINMCNYIYQTETMASITLNDKQSILYSKDGSMKIVG